VGGLALLLRSALNGSTAVLPGRFDAAEIARSLEEDGITMVSMVPTMLARLLELRGDRPAPPALRVLLLGGGPIPEPLLERALALGYPVARTYGLSEAASQVATAAPADTRPGAPPLPFVELRIADAAGDILASGEAGEIQVRGPMVMAGYWRAPEATATALRGGWLHTGDIGFLDAAGRLHVSGRRADLIVSGGENVYPAEVEAALLRHPAVAECCVLGLPDEVWGQRVVAVVVARTPEMGEGEASARSGEDPAIEASSEDSTAALAANLDAFLRERLAAYKLPRGYTFLSELPRTASGKVRREALLAEFVSPDPPA
jgi:O-succinylbenzoic acid--CoA ligase